MPPTFKDRVADHDVDPQFVSRWSPRAFTSEPVPDEVLFSLFEAARWAPSAFNSQPWVFVYARRDTRAWGPLFEALIPYNQDWVKLASVLMFVASDRFRRAEGREPSAHPSHSFDAGAAWGYLALQAHALGWAAHGMAGFERDDAHAATGLPDADFRIEAAIAVGRPTVASVLPQSLQVREVPSLRKPVGAFAFEGRYRP
jgi:nitroreductase